MNWADMGETSPGALFKILSKQSSRSMREANRENQVDEIKIHFFQQCQNSDTFISRACKGQRWPSRGLTFIKTYFDYENYIKSLQQSHEPHTLTKK
jgi:hypothetical protein